MLPKPKIFIIAELDTLYQLLLYYSSSVQVSLKTKNETEYEVGLGGLC